MNPWRLFALLMIVSYLVVGILSLPHYGVTWDEINHASRGQAYLHYFLTGKKQYDDQRSFYQMEGYDFRSWITRDGDHPVLSDIVSALFNVVFYQRLSLLGDFEAYHLYGVVIVAAFLAFIYWWVERLYGGFTGLVSVMALILYPLFYGESHFNVQKDIPETVSYISAALAFYMGITTRSIKWMLATGLLAGAALGTKLNIVFLSVSVVLWSLVWGFRKFWAFRISILVISVMAVAIWFISWPWLWQNPIANTLASLGYYRTMGIRADSSGFNTYAIQWILFATPLATLLLFFIGAAFAVRSRSQEKYKESLYVLLLFLVPVVRVTLPLTSIYGGVRQIMEYIPALAILSGIGAKYMVTWLHGYMVRKQFNNSTIQQLRVVLQLLVIASFFPITLKLIQMHPNESVYFNPMIGGLAGAAAKNIPGWGNSLGSTYRQGVRWLNANAEPNAKLATAYELMSNIPSNDLRPDIQYSNTHRSGMKREGEYLIGVTHEGEFQKYYTFKYAQNILIPVYEVSVDGVSILRVWKNDEEHTKPEYLKKTRSISATWEKEHRNLVISVGENAKITEMIVNYQTNGCTLPEDGKVEISKNGLAWEELPGSILSFPGFWWFKTNQVDGQLRYLFAGEELQKIRFTKNYPNSCLFRYPVTVSLYGL